MKKENWEILIGNAIGKVEGIRESARKELVKSIVDEAIQKLPEAAKNKNIDPGSDESKKIEMLVNLQVKKSLSSFQRFARETDWCQMVTTKVRESLLDEPWWIGKK